jgi:hypothetical protein
MTRPRANRHRITRSRQLVIDLLYFSQSVPLVAVERPMFLRELATARRDHPDRPSWTALFAKAFSLVAADCAVLRQVYFRLPVPHLYEYEESAVSIACELRTGEDASVIPVRIRNPDKMPLSAFRYKIDEIRGAKLLQRGVYYRTIAAVSSLPLFARRPLWWLALNLPRFRFRFVGTFVITSVGALGADLLSPRAPVTSILTYGPLDGEGMMRVRLLFDHRVYDGAAAARPGSIG